MTIAITDLALLGTDESSGSTIANNATSTGSEVDLAGAANTLVETDLFLRFTSTVTVGSLVVTFIPSRVTGQAYDDQPVLTWRVTPVNGTQQIYLGRFTIGARYGQVSVLNDATGADATNVFVGAKVTRIT